MGPSIFETLVAVVRHVVPASGRLALKSEETPWLGSLRQVVRVVQETGCESEPNRHLIKRIS